MRKICRWVGVGLWSKVEVGVADAVDELSDDSELGVAVPAVDGAGADALVAVPLGAAPFCVQPQTAADVIIATVRT